MSNNQWIDQERLWKLADQDNCDGDCDLEPPNKQCPECLARGAINEVGEIIGNVIRELEEEYERLEPTDVPIDGIKFEGVV